MGYYCVTQRKKLQQYWTSGDNVSVDKTPHSHYCENFKSNMNSTNENYYGNLSQWCRSYLGLMIITQLVKILPDFIEPKFCYIFTYSILSLLNQFHTWDRVSLKLIFIHTLYAFLTFSCVLHAPLFPASPFSSRLLRHLSYRINFRAICSQTLFIYVLPLGPKTKFHIQTIQQAKL
jgi:hypothetical protein